MPEESGNPPRAKVAKVSTNNIPSRGVQEMVWAKRAKHTAVAPKRDGDPPRAKKEEADKG